MLANRLSPRRGLCGPLAVALLTVAIVLPASPSEAGWGPRRRNRVYYAAPAATTYYVPAVAPTYAYPVAPTAARFSRGSGFGNGPIPGNFGNYNPSYGIGPGYFASPPGPYAPF